MASESFHAGEVALQRRSGVAERLAQAGPRVIRDHMPQQHRDFFAQLPLVLAGMVDRQGQPWASVLAGPPGFAHAPTDRALRVDALPLPHDPLRPLLQAGAPIGLLGLEAHTRRRNRLNGWVGEVDDAGFGVRVGQSFGNCPKYIHERQAVYRPAGAGAPVVEQGEALDSIAQAEISRADTFFIATAHPQASATAQAAQGVDVSHRGGEPGFVTVQRNCLSVPDFPGNSFFNTLGNLMLQPRCGLLFIDFENAGLTWLCARAELVLDAGSPRSSAGAQQLLRLHVESFRRVRNALPLHWEGSAIIGA